MEDFDLDIQKNNEEPSTLNYTLIVIILAVLLLAGGGLYWFLTKDKSEEDADMEQTEAVDETSPVSEDNATEKVTDSTDYTQESLNESSEDASENNSNSPAADNQEQATGSTGDETTEAQATNTDLVYFIVSGAFKNESNAQNKLSSLKNEGYQAVVVGPTAQGLFIVAYEGFPDFESAKEKLQSIRQENPDAWIYKKVN